MEAIKTSQTAEIDDCGTNNIIYSYRLHMIIHTFSSIDFQDQQHTNKHLYSITKKSRNENG